MINPATDHAAANLNLPRVGRMGWVMMVLKIGMLVLCAALLWRAWPEEPGSFDRVWHHPGYLLAAVLLRPAFTLLLALRLAILCRPVLPGLSAAQFVRIAFLGQMFNQFLPGGVGGDAVRAYMLRRSTAQAWPRIGGILVIDRVLGLASITGCILIFAWPLARERWGQFTLGLLTAIVTAVLVIGLTGWWRRPLGWLKASAWGRELTAGFAAMGPSRVLQAVTVALLAHGCLLVSCGLVFDLADVGLAWMDRLGVLAVALFAGALPLAVGGHGVREGTMVMLLSASSPTHGQQGLLPVREAIIVAVVTLAIHLATNLGGGVIAALLPASTSKTS